MGTGTAILHRAYMEMYFDPAILPHGIFEYVNNNMNCEDLSMNIMVTKFLEDVSWQQPGALAVKPVGKIQNLEGEACNSLILLIFTMVLSHVPTPAQLYYVIVLYRI